MKDTLLRNPRILIFCGLVLYLTHFFNLGSMPFFGGDEPRYARIGEEMLLRGNYVTPTLNFLPWLEKPPLLFWVESASYRVFGVSEFSARFPVALLATLCILASAFFLSKFRGARAGILSILILSTTVLYFAYARAASTDMPLVATFGVAMMAAFLGGRGRELKWAALSGFSLALAVLAKGPVALILFTGIVGVYCLLNQKWIWTLKQTLIAGVLFAGTAFPWFWFVWQENGFNFITTFFVNHHLARYLTPIHRHSQPFWFFVAVVLVGFFPWSAFLGSSLVRLWKKRWAFWEGRVSSQSEATLEVFLWIWILFPLCFFSFSESKLAGYILPVFPALAMLAAIEWDRMLAQYPETFPRMRGRVIGLGSVTIVVAVAVVIASVVAYGSFWYGSYLSLPLFGGALWAAREYRRRQLDRFFLTMVGSMTLFAGLAYGFAAPRIGNYHSAKELVLQIKPWLSQEEPLISYRFFHHTAHYYSGYQAMPETIPDMDSLHQYLSEHPQKRYFIMTKQGGLEDLQKELDLRSVTRKGDFYLVELNK